ncbi:hypothetical protein A3A70_01050 [candidate division WWE3 bacterium RIFCSPLOWO2_01_FULL_42_11]|uniref:Phosphatidic acid phosphatase type 2/haloperoxidase domain-containing protein n=1 Tax=candidate division WWE3 bacterium RIFCSPLOWO2_01_FULL_42_11 TaxID=1802627 RepID=A0A1F4VRV7_UNCKA|nr:MAG: hypothetical protein A3A70_01050 [candidate division WWE3 bacterium RIFCSPLOWO2_01_FULL_42_11]
MLYYPLFVILLARYLLWVMFGITLILGFKNNKFLINSVLSLVIVRIVEGIIKFKFPVDRPFIANPNLIPLVSTSDPSFPSVHAALAGAMAMMIGIYFPKYRILAFGMAILIALGRVLALVHYPRDVIVGFIIGLGISWLVLKIRGEK